MLSIWKTSEIERYCLGTKHGLFRQAELLVQSIALSQVHCFTLNQVGVCKFYVTDLTWFHVKDWIRFNVHDLSGLLLIIMRPGVTSLCLLSNTPKQNHQPSIGEYWNVLESCNRMTRVERQKYILMSKIITHILHSKTLNHMHSSPHGVWHSY